jgi:ABC-2 type transport system ATP-binding protein
VHTVRWPGGGTTIDIAVIAEDLGYAYGDRVAVDGVSLHVDAGEILGVLGPNGAGKSTTIKMLTGQLEPQAGRIEVLGMPLPAQREAIQARIGVCFEEKNLYPALSARENLTFFARLFGLRHPDLDDLLERVGLRERADDRVSGYSKGMRQRLMIARALVNSPDVLFLDEPTEGLDPVSARSVRRAISEEVERGVAVVLTTHDMYEADELADRVAFIDRGRILAVDTPEALKLQRGERSVLIRVTSPRGGIEEHRVPLDEPGAAIAVGEVLASGDVVTIHTEEATLEDVFVDLAGRGLT